jgi:hypothetical protein
MISAGRGRAFIFPEAAAGSMGVILAAVATPLALMARPREPRGTTQA